MTDLMNAKSKATVITIIIILLVISVVAITWYVKHELTVYDKDGMIYGETTVGNIEGDE